MNKMKAKLVLFTILFAIVLVACQKEKPVQKELELTDFTIIPGGSIAKISLTAAYPGKLTANLIISPNEDMTNAITIVLEKNTMDEAPYSFDFIVTGLQKTKDYWCQVKIRNDFFTKETEIKKFKTLEYNATITTKEVTAIFSNCASSGGTVNYGGDFGITSQGVCWSTGQNPTISDNHTSDDIDANDFTSNISGLSSNTTYFVRAFVTIDNCTDYGEQRTFTTLDCVPVVSTAEISNIGASQATCSGNVIHDGGYDIISRGICWSSNQNPTIENEHSATGGSTGDFTCVLSELNLNTTYFVRAYATNSNGKTGYGISKSFTTLDGIVIFETSQIDISSKTATINSIITSDGGSVITERGVCWSTSQNPDITGNHTSDGNGIGEFQSIINDLSFGEKYYIRAYATNSIGTSYGEQMFIVVPIEGTLPFPFSVSASKQVLFSKSNLYSHGYGGVYYFSDDQTIRNGSTDTGGWSGYGSDQWDLFLWFENIDFPIEGGGDGSINWRMLSVQEWLYLIEGRTNARQLYGPATIKDVQGWVLLPDDWEQPSNVNFDCNANTWTQNTYSMDQWTTMQNLGAVFLPSAGAILGYYYGNQTAWYWTSDYAPLLSQPYYFRFNENSYITDHYDFDRCSIRLVTDY